MLRPKLVIDKFTNTENNPYMNDELEDQNPIQFEEPEFDELGGKPLTDETISQEQINEMKMLGIYKPKQVTWDRWQKIQDIRPEHDLMIHMASSGVPQKDIAAALGYDQGHVSKILRVPEVRQQVSAKISEIYGSNIKKALNDRAMKSIEVVDAVLESGKESEMASMAKWVLEHSVGKASQEVHVTKNTLSEVIVKIEELKANQLRDINSPTLNLPKPVDHFDTVINEVIPKDLVIGKRSSSGGETK